MIPFRFPAFLLCLVFAFACMKEDTQFQGYTLKAGDNFSQEDYDIYCLILTRIFPDAETLVVNQETSVTSGAAVAGYLKSLAEVVNGLDTTLFIDYVQKNDSSFHLDNRFSIPSKKVVLITREEIHDIFTGNGVNDGWETFYRKYPGSSGEIIFSRIGYNTSKTQALVEMGNMYASLGGEGQVIYLEKENGQWRLVRSFVTWIS